MIWKARKKKMVRFSETQKIMKQVADTFWPGPFCIHVLAKNVSSNNNSIKTIKTTTWRSKQWIGFQSIDTDRHIADQGYAVELSVGIDLEDIRRRQMTGRAVVPESNITGLPAKAHCVFLTHRMLPKKL